MEFFGVQKYFLWIVQYNIDFQKHKRSGCSKEITITALSHTKIIMCSDGEGGKGVSFHT